MAPATGWAKPQAETSVFGPDNYMPNIIFQAWHWCFVTFSFLSWILQGWGVGQWGDEERKIQALALRFLSQLCWANQTLANQSVVCRPRASAPPGSWLEMQSVRPCPRPSASDSAFLLNSQLAPVHITLGEAVLHSWTCRHGEECWVGPWGRIERTVDQVNSAQLPSHH